MRNAQEITNEIRELKKHLIPFYARRRLLLARLSRIEQSIQPKERAIRRLSYELEGVLKND